jgi:hypothetical protein
MILFFTLSFFGVGLKWIRYDRSAHDKALTLIHLTVLVAALAQLSIVIIGEGATDAAKQLFLFNALVDVNIILLVSYFAVLISRARVDQTRIVNL